MRHLLYFHPALKDHKLLGAVDTEEIANSPRIGVFHSNAS